MKPTVSVIISAYKTEAYLPRCLDSLLKQTYKDFNVILVDNASPDSVPEICDKYAETDARFHVIHNKINIGVGDGRNTGINYMFQNAPTDYVTFLDSDDWIHESFLEKLVDVAEKQNVDIVFCSHNHCKTIDDTLKFSDYNFIPTKYNNSENFWVDTLHCLAYCIGRLFRSELFRDIRFPKSGLDDERTTYKAVLAAKSIATIPAKLYNYFINESSYMHSQWSVEKKINQLNAPYESLEYLYNHGYQKTFFKQLHTYFYYARCAFLDYSNDCQFEELLTNLKENLINATIKYCDWLPYNKAKKIYNSEVKNFIKYVYNLKKHEDKRLRTKLQAIKWRLRANRILLHKNKIFTKKAKLKYLNAIQNKR